ncbi:hypothetical protein PR048_012822 [Dryococelus australis]|uniref:Uncharacterized protein n=1 Tax=Dryococelus australis TaxID=614101 RepID=A0ABQ9HQQ3_9NEOP|nr:hypothetical protein PR048_012822 [Dryococelus australis]
MNLTSKSIQVNVYLLAKQPVVQFVVLSDLLPDDVSNIVDVWSFALKNLNAAHERTCEHYNAGDLVFLRSHPTSKVIDRRMAKLSFHWAGPYRIQQFLTPDTARLVNPETGVCVMRAHISLLKKFYPINLHGISFQDLHRIFLQYLHGISLYDLYGISLQDLSGLFLQDNGEIPTCPPRDILAASPWNCAACKTAISCAGQARPRAMPWLAVPYAPHFTLINSSQASLLDYPHHRQLGPIPSRGRCCSCHLPYWVIAGAGHCLSDQLQGPGMWALARIVSESQLPIGTYSARGPGLPFLRCGTDNIAPKYSSDRQVGGLWCRYAGGQRHSQPVKQVEMWAWMEAGRRFDSGDRRFR